MQLRTDKTPTTSSILSALLLLVANSLTTSAATTSECLRDRSSELSGFAACGDKGLLAYCISNDIPTLFDDSLLQGELERCLNTAGCSPAEAQIEAYWTLRRCHRSDDLRKRLGQAARDGPEAEAVMPMPTIPAMAITARADAASTYSATSSSPSPCFTETSVSITACPVQSTGPSSGKLLSCYPTTAPSSVCADGLICRTDSEGNPSCMYAQNDIGTAGLIIAIFFGSAVFISITTMMFFCCRERRVQNRLAKAAEAAAIAKEAKNAAMVASKRPNGAARVGSRDASDRQPLMAPMPPLPPLPPLPTGSSGVPTPSYQTPRDDPPRQNPFVDEQHPLR